MNVRPSPIGRRWYPDDPQTLARDLDQYLDAVRPLAPRGVLWGIVAPHAGLRYSGPVAAWAYTCLRGQRPQLVAVVGPMHSPARAPVLTTAHEAYATPLGMVMVDIPAVHQLDRALRERLGYGLTPVRNDPEHAIEIELPFLQHVLGTFHLLPVMLRDQRVEVAEALGHALAATLRGRHALLVASSDLSHYYPQARARELDAVVLGRLEAFDPAGLLAAALSIERGACGAAAIAAVLWAARDLGADNATVLRYGTSGDTTGEHDSVVGYGAAVIWQSPP
jgi:AmmeMemoRadiSam system protein B